MVTKAKEKVTKKASFSVTFFVAFVTFVFALSGVT